MNPVSQIFYSFSTTVWHAGLAGAGSGPGPRRHQAGQKRLTEVLTQAGFNWVRRAAETPTNMVLDVRA
ncbi:MAG: hypothetical protein R3C16_02485 [Hyphomonadaceae bacterium]